MTTVSLLQDPANEGGTATAVQWYRSWMDANGGEREEYYLDEVGRGGFRALKRWQPATPALPRVLPRLHVPQYPAARRRVSPICTAASEVHVVGASATHGFLAGGARPLLVWFATLLADEREASMHLRGSLRRFLYSATLPPLAHLEHGVLRSAERVIAMSPHTASLVVDQGLAAADRVQVLPVPVDSDRFSPSVDDEPRKGVLFVGRANDPRKGYDRLLRFAANSKSASKVGLTIVSPSEPLTRNCDVTWLTRVDDLASTYRRASVLALPSRQEGLGIVAFEALASGTPVVAFRCGGPDEYLEQSQGALLVDDDAAFQAALELLLEDPGASQQFGARGRDWVVENMSAKRFLADQGVFSLA